MPIPDTVTIRSRKSDIVMLAAVAALGSLAIHMFVPAMPDAAASLDAPDGALQLSLTVYLVSLAIGQVGAGPLSDRFGRRPLLFAGTLVFTIGSALCWTATSVAMLLLGRVVEAVGASCGLVVGRAMASDRSGRTGARDMALLSAIIMLSPMFAPVIGGAVAHAAGWRAIFGVLTVTGLVCTAAIAACLPETLTASSREQPGLLRAWSQLARSRSFLANWATGTLLSSGLFVYLAASPFFLIESYGVAKDRLGTLFSLVAMGAGAGALTASRLAGSPRGRHAMQIGVATAAIGALALVALVAAGVRSPVAVVVPMAIFAFGGGIVMPSAMTAGLAAVPGRSGTAASLYGALQMAGTATATFAVALLPSHDPLLPAAIIAGLALLAASLQMIAGGRNGRY